MPSYFDKTLQSLRDRIPERRLLLAPADAFFCHHMEIPADVQAAGGDVSEAIELMLEGLSPFPVDHLFWGYIREPDRTEVLAYAIPHARLRKLGVDNIDAFFHAFPGFLTRFGETHPGKRVTFLCENGSVSALYHLPDRQVPERILSRRVAGDFLTDEAILATRDRLANAVPADGGWTVEEGVWVGEGYKIDGERHLSFKHRHLTPETSGNPTERSFGLDAEATWAADIHSRVWRTAQRKERERSRYVWLSTVAAMGFFVFLILFQSLTWGFDIWNGRQTRRIVAEQPAVLRVNDTWALAARLTQSTEQDIAPFRMLELVNHVRPDSVYFTRTRATAHNEVRIEGLSNAVAPVNAYAESLRRLPAVEEVENVFETRDGQTRFDLTVRFREAPARLHPPAAIPALTPADDFPPLDESEFLNDATEPAE
ncbi:MAG: hypothetical protein JJT96_03175 [Opitutales bacterium]|nr:hypothetical protein [Opitutales bacterium]